MNDSRPGADILINIPVLNEIDNIGPLVAAIERALTGLDYMLLFVDDGSTDGTLEFIGELTRRSPRVRLLRRRKMRHGCQRGGALFDGMVWGLANTRCTVFVEMDGDLSHRPEELRTGLEELNRSHSDLVIASKYLPGSRTIRRPFTRRAVSALCNVGVRLLISRQLSDYSNGYRFYRRAVAETVAQTHIRYTSPIYLSEFAALCLARGYRVSEFSSTYVGRNEGLSKLRPIDLVKATLAIVEICARYRWNRFRTRSVIPSNDHQSPVDNGTLCVACRAALNGSIAARLPQSWLAACPSCRTLHYFPRSSGDGQAARHNAPGYQDLPYFKNRRARVERVRDRCRATFAEIGRIVDVGSLRGQPVLDVGCSTGEFLEAARDAFKIHPIGVDVSHDAVATLKNKHIDGEVATLEEASAAVCDLPVVVAIDVVEHVADPTRFFAAVAERLRPGGAGYFETPNPDSTVYRLGAMLSKLFRGRPAVVFERLFPPEHQYYFSSDALAQLARSAGLDVVRLFSRSIPLSDAALSPPLKVSLATTQLIDRLRGQRTLLCMLVKKPLTAR